MKRIILSLSTLLTIFCTTFAAKLTDGAEYYIINDFYGKLLGQSSDGSTPQLSVEDKNSDADSYVFVAESASGDYFYLRQKSSGKYLAASGSDDWSIVFESAKGTDNRFQWSITTGIKTRITNRKNTDKRLGCDWGNKDYEPVYYDKNAGVMNFWSVIPVKGGSSHDYNNARGTRERDYYALAGENITLDEALDLHIYRENNPLGGGSVNITNERGWVIFDNCTPTNVKQNFLSSIRVNGQPAILDQNVRIAIYLNGAAVIPCTPDEIALTGYKDLNYNGEVVEITNGNHKDLVTDNNTIRSFKLRRGYMATLATDKNGYGYSRVYVADHKDIEVNDLPDALDMRISSIHIKRWQYTSKKGFGGSSNDAYKLRCGWNYNWDANSTSSIDVEYIPIRQHRYWPSMSNVNGKEASTATLSINEPDHPEQHNGCSCNGVMNAWTATTITPDFLPAGSRIGSPAPTDQGWLKEYFGHIDDMAYRCDFSVTHGYWGPSDAKGTSGWNNRINSIYNETKRPLWITEWEYGSSWYSDKSIYDGSVNDMAIKTIEILDALETNSHLERYAYYNTDAVWKLHCWYDDGWITPLGEAYRYVKSDFAYKASEQKVPTYWAPSKTEKPSVNGVSLSNGKYSIRIENKNNDFTTSLIIQAQSKDGSWNDIVNCTDRWILDGDTQSFDVSEDMLVNIQALRVKVTTKVGSAQSADFPFTIPDFSDYADLDDMQNLNFDKGTFVTSGVRTYAKDVTSTSRLSQAQPVDGWSITTNGDARAAGQYAWGCGYGLGDENFPMIAKDQSGKKDGGAFAIVSVWEASTQYTQKVLLTEGKYKITFPIYNIGGEGEMSKNLTGIIFEDGTEHLIKTKKFTPNTWKEETIEFELQGKTPALLSLGYIAANSGSSSMPHLLIDSIRFEKDGIIYPTVKPQPVPDPEPVFATVSFVVDELEITSSLEVGSIIPTPATPEKEGYTFAGWMPEFVEGTTVPEDGITYVGLWSVNQYKLTYMFNGENVAEYTVNYGVPIPGCEYQPEDSRYTIMAWRSDAEYTTMPAHDVIYTADFADVISTIAEVGSNDNTVYTLTGIKVKNTKNLLPGIYVIGGRKYMIK